MVVDLKDTSEIRSNRGTVRYINTREHGIYTRKSGEISVCKVLVIHGKEVRNPLYIVELEKNQRAHMGISWCYGYAC